MGDPAGTESTTGGIILGVASAERGTTVGAAIGVWFGGVGAVPGAVIRAAFGGYYGIKVGSDVGAGAVNYYYDNK